MVVATMGQLTRDWGAVPIAEPATAGCGAFVSSSCVSAFFKRQGMMLLSVLPAVVLLQLQHLDLH
jgi:hypothetical protein